MGDRQQRNMCRKAWGILESDVVVLRKEVAGLLWTWSKENIGGHTSAYFTFSLPVLFITVSVSSKDELLYS